MTIDGYRPPTDIRPREGRPGLPCSSVVELSGFELAHSEPYQAPAKAAWLWMNFSFLLHDFVIYVFEGGSKTALGSAEILKRGSIPV